MHENGGRCGDADGFDVMDWTVVIPFGGPWDAQRQAAFDHVEKWWMGMRFDVLSGGAPRGEWSKGAAVASLLTHVETPGVIVADADVRVPEAALFACLRAVTAGFAWAQPHTEVFRLNRHATIAAYEGWLGDVRPLPRRNAMSHPAPEGGGMVILPTRTAETVPLDSRFYGWGGEDISWARALDTLAGSCYRVDGPMWHFHHERQERRPGNRGSEANEVLAAQYLDAVGDSSAMRALVP